MVVNDNIIYFVSKTDQAMKNVLCVSWQIRPLLCTVHILWWQSVRIKINASTYTIIQTPLPSILPLSTEQCGLFTWSIIILQGRVGQRGETGRQSRILFISQIVHPVLPLLHSSEDKISNQYLQGLTVVVRSELKSEYRLWGRKWAESVLASDLVIIIDCSVSNLTNSGTKQTRRIYLSCITMNNHESQKLIS